MSVTEERIQELNSRFLEFMSKSENVESATKEIYEDLLDEVLMGFVFDVHRTTKTGSSDVEEGIPDDESFSRTGRVRPTPGEKIPRMQLSELRPRSGGLPFRDTLGEVHGNGAKQFANRVQAHSKQLERPEQLQRRYKRRRRRRRLEHEQRQTEAKERSQRYKEEQATEEQSKERGQRERSHSQQQRELSVQLREHVLGGQEDSSHSDLRRDIRAHEEAVHQVYALPAAHRGSEERDEGEFGTGKQLAAWSRQSPRGRGHVRGGGRAELERGVGALGSRGIEPLESGGLHLDHVHVLDKQETGNEDEGQGERIETRSRVADLAGGLIEVILRSFLNCGFAILEQSY